MLIDRQLRFDSANAVTAAEASTDLIDLGAARNLGVGTPLYLVSIVTTTMTDGAGNTYPMVVTLQTSSTAGGTYTDHVAQTAITFPANSAAGTIMAVPLAPFSSADTLQFVRAYYTPTGGSLTAGAFTTFITSDPHNWRAYADGFTIS